jgi:hypothetical protein
MGTQILELVDLVVAGFTVGAIVWFFFIQSPALISSMGREKFVPIQMRLTKVLFRVLSVSALVLVVLSWFASGGIAFLAATLSAVAAVVAHFFVIPRALRAGGKGRVETVNAGGDASVAKFASEGAGPSAAIWHRTVVVFVVIILAGTIVNMGAVHLR